MTITPKEKERLLSSINLYEQYRLNKLKKYRRNNIDALKKIINECNSSLEELEEEIICYANIYIKSGLILFGYCFLSFGKSILKENLMSVITVERIKRENKKLSKNISTLEEEKNELIKKEALLIEECKALREEGGELQLCINSLRKEKGKLYARVLDLMEKLKKITGENRDIDDKIIGKRF
ncbi:MAG: hypothetical protein ACX932_03945 [Gammaproteobacteria bacterium]